MKRFLMICVIIMSLIQISVPVYMMVNRFDTLKNGVEYKFKVAPVDPHDAFRGRYLAIRVDTNNLRDNDYNKNNSKEYAVIKTDENGFAYIEKTDVNKPSEGDYVTAKRRYGSLNLPFDRYYMEEKLAPKAEKSYSDQRKDAYIKVKVKNGNSVIEGLYIHDVRIEDYVKTQ